jgi:mannose-6-phosphate isomerase-like protein (cupin superfamily)
VRRVDPRLWALVATRHYAAGVDCSYKLRSQEDPVREGPDVIVNALAGERVVFHTHAADTSGELIQFDLILTKIGGSPPAHVHLHQSERFQVRSGAIRVMIGGEERVLHEGDEALVPAGTPHRW